jgi:hypothetical protein
MELIPYVGPIIGPTPAVIVALFEHPITAVWVTLLFIALQQLEGHIVAPQVFGYSLRINPILIILSLLIGGQLYGVAGALIALPVAAVIRETVSYLRRHLVLEPWNATATGVVGAGAGAAGAPAADARAPEEPPPGPREPPPGPREPPPGPREPPPGPRGPEPERCPECGTAARLGDAFCGSCGASLEPQVRTRG